MRRVYYPTAGREITMSLFSRTRQESVTNSSPREIRAGQRRARLTDANASTRPNQVTVKELRQRPS